MRGERCATCHSGGRANKAGTERAVDIERTDITCLGFC
ncbi:hypothetical protein E2C01_098952 [Portunus trituberculatus]|uniref:Uncharacterized protein n=1 Tax=Portunus trituberculatus TaxID=210409 RepID=A0A5B7K8A8_PORTR|nr:hypothetical protein [Portunus trituberculatus]